jgi:molecular chaperone GrpE
MSEQSAADVAQVPTLDRSQALTPQAIENILTDFRCWLQRAAGAAEPKAEEAPAEPVGLQALVSQFVALRHEVNLQTRATRAQQEQNVQTLATLEQALQGIRHAQAETHDDPEKAAEEGIRPLLKTLVDVTELMGLARREVERVQQALTPQLGKVQAELGAVLVAQPELRLADAAPEVQPAGTPAAQARPSFLARLLGRGTAEPARADAEAARPLAAYRALVRQADENRRRQIETALAERAALIQQQVSTVCRAVDSVLAGYTMSAQRLERTLEQLGLEAISCRGELFDPETMEVVEAVGGTGLRSGEVIEEVRRGYLWRGRVFRYAQVKVARC